MIKDMLRATDPNPELLSNQLKTQLILAIQEKTKSLTGLEAAQLMDCYPFHVSAIRGAFKKDHIDRRIPSNDLLLLMAQKLGLSVQVISQ